MEITFLENSSISIPCWGFGTLKDSEDIFKLNCLKIYYKYHHQKLPAYFESFPFKTTEDTPRDRPRRQILPTLRYADSQENLPILNPLITIEKTERQYSIHCIRHYIPKLINSNFVDATARSKILTHSLKSFIAYSKNIIVLNYNTPCQTVNCYICGQPPNIVPPAN